MPDAHPALPRLDTATPEDFDAKIASTDGELVVAYFWGPQCPNCEVFAAHFPRLREALSGERVRFVKVNAYEHPELATRFGLFGIPQFLLFRDSRRLGRMSEFKSDDFFLGVLRDQLPA